MNIDSYIEKNKNTNLREIDLRQMADTHRFIVDPSGRRTRKTRNKKRKMYATVLDPNNVEKRFYQAAPTHDQAKEIFWNDLLSFTKPLNPQINYTDLSVTFKHNGTRLRVIGLNRPERIEGSPNNGIHISEMPELGTIDVWDNHIYPTLIDTDGFAWIDGTPDLRYPWYGDFIERYFGCRPLKSEPFKPLSYESPTNPEWIYYHWHSIDVLGAKIINQIRQESDELSFRQEYEGEFIQHKGIVYYAYTNDNNIEQPFLKDAETHLCFDFNVNPMTILINQMIGHTERGNARWCYTKEFVLHNSNTAAASNKCIDWLNENGFNGQIYITGDYTGKRKQTSSDAGYSDWQIIKEIFNGRWGFNDLRLKTRNVANKLKDSINATNAMFCTVDGEIRQYVNKKSCPYLHKDLTRQVYREDGTLNDEGGLIGHRSDAARYDSFNFNPIQQGINKMEIR